VKHAVHTAARRGWEIFGTTTPAPSRDEINAALENVQLPAISKRMYDHYGRLARHGVPEYMPINDFDMALKNGRLGKRSA
jgi:hypothetical protein